VAAAATLVPFTSANAQAASADPSQTKLNYPNTTVTAAQTLTADAPLSFSYPDALYRLQERYPMDRNVIPCYKGTWGNIRKAGTMDEFKRTVSFKNRRFSMPGSA